MDRSRELAGRCWDVFLDAGVALIPLWIFVACFVDWLIRRLG